MSDLSTNSDLENRNICKKFEEAWKSGPRPRVEDFYSNDAPGRDNLFADLIQLDMKLRLLAGERIDWDDYLQRFPQKQTLINELRLASSETGTFHGELHEWRPESVAPISEHEVLGDYKLIREIGKGGMGVVYEARHIKLNKRVAVKLLPLAGMLNKSTRARFQNEAKAAAQLEHAHIVPVYAFGAEKGTHFYAMQYIEGNNLSQVITALRETSATRPSSKSKPTTHVGDTTLPGSGRHNHARSNNSSGLIPGASAKGSTSSRQHLETLARLGIQVSEALQYAHDMGIVHRDIKPSNLILDPHGDVWVADFGLAQIQGDAELTAPGDIIGTLRYMSPEQAYAKRIVVDHRTDIFSLGATLYELLTLRQAFDGTTRNEIMRQVAFDDPPAPRKINHRLPDELSTIVMKSLAKSPDDRYQTAAELAADLRAWRNGEPIKARKPTVVQRAAKWANRHRSLVASLSTSILVVFLATITVLAYTAQTERKARKTAQAKSDELAQALQTSEGRRLVTLASLELSHNPGLASALAALGTKLHPSPEANNALLAALDANHERTVLRHHKVAVGTVQFSPDGKKVITTGSAASFLSDPEPAYICDAETGQRLVTLQDEATITSAAMGPLGNRVLTASTPSDARARTEDDLASIPPAIWDVARGTKVGVLRDAFLFQAHPAAFALSEQRTLIVAPAKDNTARIYNAAGDPTMTLRGHDARVTLAAFSPDGQKIVTASDDNTVRIWDAVRGDPLATFDWWKQQQPDNTQALVRSATFSPDSKQLLTSSLILGTDLWDLESGERRNCGRGEFATFSPNGELIGLYAGQNARVLNARTLATRYELPSHQRFLTTMVFSHDSRHLATCSGELMFRVRDAANGDPLSDFRGHALGVSNVAFHPTEPRLISGSSDHTARIWNLKSGAKIAQLDTEVFNHNPIVDFRADSGQLLVTSEAEFGASLWEQGAPVFAVAGRPSLPDAAGRHFLAIAEDRINVHDYQTGQTLASLTTTLGTFGGAKISPDGRTAAVVLKGGPTWLWKWETDDRIVLPDSGGYDAIFHPTKNEVVAFDKDSQARVYRSDNGDEIAKPPHTGKVRDLQYSLDGSRLLVVTDGNAGYLFDAKTYEPLRTFGKPSHRFQYGRFSADGKRVLTYRARGKTIYCWDTDTGELLRTLDSPSGRIYIEMHPTEASAVIASNESGLSIWDFESGDRKQLSDIPTARAGFVADGRIVTAAAQPWAQADIDRKSAVEFGESELLAWDADSEVMANRFAAQSAFQWLGTPSGADRLLVGTRSYGVSLFDPNSHELNASFPAHAAPISFAQFTPDGKRIITCSWDQKIAIWDAATQQRLKMVSGLASPILAAAMSPDGKQLAIGGRDGSMALRELAQIDQSRTLEGLASPIADCSFSSFGARLVARTVVGDWQAWNTANGEVIDYGLNIDQVKWVEFAPGGNTLLVIPKTQRTDQYQVTLVPPLGPPIQLPHDSPVVARFDLRGQRVVTVTGKATFVWDAATGQKLRTLVKPGAAAFSAAFDERGDRVVTHHGTSITVWDKTGEEILTIKKGIDFLPAEIRDPFSPNGASVVTITPNSRARIIPLEPLAASTNQVRSLSDDERTRFHVNLVQP